MCPVELASEMSALRAARVGDHAEHGLLHEGPVERAMKVQEVICGRWRRRSRGGKRQKLLGSAIGRCGAGGSLKQYYDTLEEKVEVKLHCAATGEVKLR